MIKCFHGRSRSIEHPSNKWLTIPRIKDTFNFAPYTKQTKKKKGGDIYSLTMITRFPDAIEDQIICNLTPSSKTIVKINPCPRSIEKYIIRYGI